MAFAAKIDEKALPGTAFWGKNRFLLIFGLPRGTQKCSKVYEEFLTFRSGKPSGGNLGCSTPFFSILPPFWAHSGLLLGQFLANLGCFYRFLEVVGVVGLLGCWGCWGRLVGGLGRVCVVWVGFEVSVAFGCV